MFQSSSDQLKHFLREILSCTWQRDPNHHHMCPGFMSEDSFVMTMRQSCCVPLSVFRVLSASLGTGSCVEYQEIKIEAIAAVFESKYHYIFLAIRGYFASKAIQTQCWVQRRAANMHYTKYAQLPQLTCGITSQFLVLTGLLDLWMVS